MAPILGKDWRFLCIIYRWTIDWAIIKMQRKIILASSSPRRREILEKMGLEFEVIPSGYEENLDSFDFTYEKIENLAYFKAYDVAKKLSSVSENSQVVLGADTVVVFQNMILGKPKDSKDAFRMLKMLSGQKHFVVTSICVFNSVTFEKMIQSTTSYVEFEELTDFMINEYVETFMPLDKAGSYGIQELPKGFVKAVEGSFENIIGLCPLSVRFLLDNL